MKALAKSRRAKVRTEAILAPPNHGILGPYFGELQSIPLLDAAQEIALAREIETLEIAHWCALLSHRPALRVIASAFAQHATRRASGLDALCGHGTSTRAAKPSPSAVARQLRRIDPRRAGLYAADAAVRERFCRDDRARNYLARVGQAREAEQRAKGRFVVANLRLVISMSRRYARSGLPLEDLIQEGNMGLMRAVERFDHRRGYRFSTYAAWWIRHGISRAVSDKARLVRIPVHARDDMARLARAADSSITKTGTVPSAQELATQTGLTEAKLTQLRQDARLEQPVSLDHSRDSGSEKALHDRFATAESSDLDDTIDLASWREDLPRLLEVLRPIEADVLRLRFGLDGGEELTLRDIGVKYNLSRERIRQLQVAAIEKLRMTLGVAVDPTDAGEAAA